MRKFLTFWKNLRWKKILNNTKNIAILLVVGLTPLYVNVYYGDYVEWAKYKILNEPGAPDISLEKLNLLHKYATFVQYPVTYGYKNNHIVTEEEFLRFMSTWINVADRLKYKEGTFVCVQYASTYRDLMRQMIPNAEVYAIGGYGHCMNLVHIRRKDGTTNYYIVEPQDTLAIILQENKDKNGKFVKWQTLMLD